MTEQTNKIKIFLVDDDAIFLKSLEIEFLQHADFDVETYASGELCMQHLSNNPDVIILDYHLNGVNPNAINGIQTLDMIKKVDANIQVVMLSSQDKIDIAVKCMHHRAFDYVVKSETAFLRLLKVISAISKYRKMERELNWYMSKF